jgi:hypothetical protein
MANMVARRSERNNIVQYIYYRDKVATVFYPTFEEREKIDVPSKFVTALKNDLAEIVRMVKTTSKHSDMEQIMVYQAEEWPLCFSSEIAATHGHLAKTTCTKKTLRDFSLASGAARSYWKGSGLFDKAFPELKVALPEITTNIKQKTGLPWSGKPIVFSHVLSHSLSRFPYQYKIHFAGNIRDVCNQWRVRLARRYVHDPLSFSHIPGFDFNIIHNYRTGEIHGGYTPDSPQEPKLDSYGIRRACRPQRAP